MTEDIIRNEIKELYNYCQTANFNELVHAPEKASHFSSTDYKNGHAVHSKIKYFVGKYSKDKEEDFRKVLIRMLHKLRHDINDLSIRIFNSIGELMFDAQYNKSNYVSIQLDISNYPRGMYQINLFTN